MWPFQFHTQGSQVHNKVTDFKTISASKNKLKRHGLSGVRCGGFSQDVTQPANHLFVPLQGWEFSGCPGPKVLESGCVKTEGVLVHSVTLSLRHSCGQRNLITADSTTTILAQLSKQVVSTSVTNSEFRNFQSKSSIRDRSHLCSCTFNQAKPCSEKLFS